MKPNPDFPSRERLEELLLESRSRTLSAAEREELNAILRNDETARTFAAQALMDDAALAEALRAEQVESLLAADSGGMLGAMQPSPAATRRPWLSWRPLTAAAAGIVLGMFCTAVAFGYVMPRAVATASRLFALVDGSFEKQSGRVASGFPSAFGVWSGDEAEIVRSDAARDGMQALRFVRAEGDAAVANSPANSCDVYQLVDLRSLKADAAGGEASLELSAQFLDARMEKGEAVNFTCRLHVFAGSPDSLRVEWPLTRLDALAFGTGAVQSHGGAPHSWRSVTAKVLLPPQADFAVVHLVTSKKPTINNQAAEFGAQFADDVRLTLKSQPMLPVRLAQR